MNRFIYTVMASTMVVPMMCWAGSTSLAEPDGASTLETVLHTQYPQVARWQLSRTVVAQRKRRPVFFASIDGRVEIYRDGNLFQVRSADSEQAVTYRVEGYREVTVAATYLPKGQALQERSTVVAEREVFALACDPASDAMNFSGWRLRRSIKAAEVLCSKDIEAPPLIARNDVITIRCESGMVSAAVPGLALSEGGRGESIRVRRDRYYRVLTATVIDKGEVNACS